MPDFDRVTLDPQVMGGKPCIRGMGVTVGMVVGLVPSGHDIPAVLQAYPYPYLEAEDVRQALAYAASRLQESETSLLPMGQEVRRRAR